MPGADAASPSPARSLAPRLKVSRASRRRPALRPQVRGRKGAGDACVLIQRSSARSRCWVDMPLTVLDQPLFQRQDLDPRLQRQPQQAGDHVAIRRQFGEAFDTEPGAVGASDHATDLSARSPSARRLRLERPAPPGEHRSTAASEGGRRASTNNSSAAVTRPERAGGFCMATKRTPDCSVMSLSLSDLAADPFDKACNRFATCRQREIDLPVDDARVREIAIGRTHRYRGDGIIERESRATQNTLRLGRCAGTLVLPGRVACLNGGFPRPGKRVPR